MICILEFGIFGLLRYNMNFTVKTLKSFLESLLISEDHILLDLGVEVQK